MKFKLFVTLIICVFCIDSNNAQEMRNRMKERLESKKIAFISDKLNLSPEEAQVFWPVYNQYTADLAELKIDKDRFSDLEAMEEKADEMIDAMLDREQKHLDLKKAYAKKFKEVVGSKKTIRLFMVERKFRESMVKELKERRGRMMRGDR